MVSMRRLIIAILFIAVFYDTHAQSGTNSPYSQYGVGILSDQATGFNKGMNGLGIGFHNGKEINPLNPASYSAMDSLSFIFDAGITGQIAHFKEGDISKNATNSNFEYVVAGFRAFKHLGFSFGLLPFSNVGFNYSFSKTLPTTTTTYTNTFNGSGGLHKFYLGAGWQPLKHFSIGVNVAYLWGELDHSVVNSYSDNTINNVSRIYSANVTSYTLDFGAQYDFNLSSKDNVTLGVTYFKGHNINGKPTLDEISKNSETSVADTATYRASHISLPDAFGVGLMWNHNNKWRVGADYSLQKWGSIDALSYESNDASKSVIALGNSYSDRSKITVGADYCPNEKSRRALDKAHYMFGFSYATPYIKINGEDGPKEFSASAGISMPIINNWNNRSMLNVSVQWIHTGKKELIEENCFRLNIGLTFNERWFAKWKVE